MAFIYILFQDVWFGPLKNVNSFRNIINELSLPVNQGFKLRCLTTGVVSYSLDNAIISGSYEVTESNVEEGSATATQIQPQRLIWKRIKKPEIQLPEKKTFNAMITLIRYGAMIIDHISKSFPNYKPCESQEIRGLLKNISQTSFQPDMRQTSVRNKILKLLIFITETISDVANENDELDDSILIKWLSEYLSWYEEKVCIQGKQYVHATIGNDVIPLQRLSEHQKRIGYIMKENEQKKTNFKLKKSIQTLELDDVLMRNGFHRIHKEHLTHPDWATSPYRPMNPSMAFSECRLSLTDHIVKTGLYLDEDLLKLIQLTIEHQKEKYGPYAIYPEVYVKEKLIKTFNVST